MPLAFTPIVMFQSPSSASTMLAAGRMIPATFTAPSERPKCETVRSIQWSTSLAWDTLTAWWIWFVAEEGFKGWGEVESDDDDDGEGRSVTAARNASSLMSASESCAPCEASCCAMASPIPEAARRACAHTFARDGCSGLALLDINHEDLLILTSDLENSTIKQRTTNAPLKIHIYPLDIRQETQVEQAITSAARTFGRLGYVVNAAGIAMKHIGGAAFAKTEDWQRTDTFFVLRAAARIMLEQSPIHSTITGRELQRGSIINFSSIQGLAAVPMSTAYTASKHAVLGLTKTASEDYAAKGLRINAIYPGYTETPITTRDAMVRQAMEDRVARAVPMGRMGRVDEIADRVFWLAGGRSSFATGIGLSVDGGYMERSMWFVATDVWDIFARSG